MSELQGLRTTSLLAFVEVLGNLGQRQLQVLKTIDEIEPCNNLMISNRLNLPINSITPRVHELKRKGLIKEEKIDVCPFTRRKTVFYVRVRK